MRTRPFLAIALVTLVGAQVVAQTPRPMTFLDVQNMRTTSGLEISPDGRSMLYALSTPDWAQARRQSDIYLVSTERGLPSTRRLTFTADKNETNPKWSKDGTFIAFLSDRDAPTAPAAGRGGTGGLIAPAAYDTGTGPSRNQLFVLRLDGGEAKRITNARDGVANFSFSKDGRFVVYKSGRRG